MPRKRRQPKKSAPNDPSKTGSVIEKRPVRSDSVVLASDADAPRSDDLRSGIVDDGSSLTTAQWTTLRQKILSDQQIEPLATVYGGAAKRGAVFRWGMATATDCPCTLEFEWLSRLAAGAGTDASRFQGIQPGDMLVRLQDHLTNHVCALSDASTVLVWAAAMPSLLNHLEENEWWNLLGAIQDFRDGLLHRDPTEPWSLIGVAEIGLTLAWCLRALPSCRRLEISSINALQQWCEQDDLAISEVLAHPHHARLALASVLRSQLLLKTILRKKKSSKPQSKKTKHQAKANPNGSRILLEALGEIGIELATWVAAMTRTGGAHSLTTLSKHDLRDDARTGGLLMLAAELDGPTLIPAMQAALGESKSKGRLSWQVSLPESMLHDEDAKLACLLPEWDVRRGRTVIQYAGRHTNLELTAGKSSLVSGRCDTEIFVDGQRKDPCGDWVATCEYSDDDVHYLELEQMHDGGIVLQRQVMVVREDCCCFFADAVVQGHARNSGPLVQEKPSQLAEIEYQLRLPLADAVRAEPEEQTTEFYLRDDRRRAIVLPLASGEWKNSNSSMRMQATEDQHLLITSVGTGQVYAPLWFDLARNRFRLNRTWRQLTVGEQLRTVAPNTAAAYRIQVGKSQWILYRSMAESLPRTFFGKHMIADFYCARFNAKAREFEDLITVEDTPS